MIKHPLYAEYLRRLRKYAKLPLPVQINMVDYRLARANIYGHCFVRGGEFIIEIDSELSDGDKKHTLVHEWAHALIWLDGGVEHGEAWGVAYARCYRIAVEGWKPKKLSRS